MAESSAQPTSENSLAAGAISLPELIFTALATLAPLTLVAGVMPLHFLVGGDAVPGGYLVAAIVMALFAVGLNTVVKYLRSSGAFYTIISRGLGKVTGTTSAMLAILAYNALQVSTYGVIGTYAAQSFAHWFNIDLPWWVYAFVSLIIVGALGLRGITASAKVLGAILILEVLALIVLAVVVFSSSSTGSASFESYNPATVLRPSTLAVFALIFGAFMGFESTVIYSEEVRGGSRAVRKATYFVVAFIGIFYSLMALVIVTAYGAAAISDSAEKNLDGLVIELFSRFTNPVVFEIVNVLLILSAFAALLALHNAANRYVYALGREGIVPRIFGRTHSKTKSPWVAALLQNAFAIIVVVLCIVGKADPYTVLLLVGSALGFLAIIILWALCSLAALTYLRRHHPSEGWWRTFVAPGLAFVALAATAVLVIVNFDLFTDGVFTVNAIVVVLSVVAAAGGIARGVYLKFRRPDIYSTMAITLEVDVVENAQAEQQ
jgi:amino acid transporter